MFKWMPQGRRKQLLIVLGVLVIVLLIVRLSALVAEFNNPQGLALLRWIRGNEQVRSELVTTQREACPGAPFILPAEGFIGLLYADPRGPYSKSKPHQGLDIFSDTESGITPVFAAYDGYITREAEWRSSLIQRIPDDPLQPGRQIWLYYTHMADKQGNDYIIDNFEAGSKDIFVERGTLLGYTGDFNGDAIRDIWVHLHFSIIRDDGAGRYTNELDFQNSIDPSAYLGLGLSYTCLEIESDCSYRPDCEQG